MFAEPATSAVVVTFSFATLPPIVTFVPTERLALNVVSLVTDNVLATVSVDQPRLAGILNSLSLPDILVEFE